MWRMRTGKQIKTWSGTQKMKRNSQGRKEGEGHKQLGVKTWRQGSAWYCQGAACSLVGWYVEFGGSIRLTWRADRPGMQGGYNIQKTIYVSIPINAIKDKTHVIISKDTEKTSDKIQYPLVTKKIFQKVV